MLHLAKAIAIRLWKDERGASLLEYSVLVGLITAAVVTTIGLVSGWVGGRWNQIYDNLVASPGGTK
jgi:pilus assembly protein Flp/PilA